MKLGGSVHWTEALYAIAGTREISAEPIMEYFEPLMEWLDDQIETLGLTPGWDETSCPPNTITGEQLSQIFLNWLQSVWLSK